MKKNLVLITILLLVSSCDTQLGTAVTTAVKNVFNGKAFGDSASDIAYADYQKKPLNEAVASGSMCLIKAEKTSPLSSGRAGEISKIKDLLCSCKSWGTCEKDSCDCGLLCPNDFSILNRTGLAMSNSAENSLSFTNSDYFWRSNDPTYQGYCWGHATVTSKYNRLAKFNPSLPKLFSGQEHDAERMSYYKEIVKKVHNNEPVDIPGFRNLLEFSELPSIKSLLEEDVKQTWAENAMTLQGLAIAASSTPQGADYYNKLFDDIESRLRNFQSPTIVMNMKGSSTFAHAVLVSGSKIDRDGNRILCIRDNSDEPSESLNCNKPLILDKNTGTCRYPTWNMPRYGLSEDLGQIRLSHSENGTTVEQIKNLRTKCLDDKTCPKD